MFLVSHVHRSLWSIVRHRKKMITTIGKGAPQTNGYYKQLGVILMLLFLHTPYPCANLRVVTVCIFS